MYWFVKYKITVLNKFSSWADTWIYKKMNLMILQVSFKTYALNRSSPTPLTLRELNKNKQ